MKMRTMMLALMAAAALSVTAQAADNLKAPSLLGNGYPVVKCGMYYGVNTIGNTGFVSNAAVGTQIAQGSIGLTVGYSCPLNADGSSFAFVDGAFDVANLNGSSNGFAFGGPLTFEQRLGFGTPISTLLNAIPGFSSLPAVPSLIPLPAGVTAGPSSPYVFVGLHEDDVSQFSNLGSNREYLISVGFGIGMKTRLSNGVVFDPFVEAILPSSKMCFGPVGGTLCTQVSNKYEVGFHLEY
jgi:hypothetical protein